MGALGFFNSTEETRRRVTILFSQTKDDQLSLQGVFPRQRNRMYVKVIKKKGPTKQLERLQLFATGNRAKKL